VKFLGHTISKDGISVDPSKVQEVMDWKPHKSVHQIHSFLGLAGYYCRFIPDFSRMGRPMTELLKKGVKIVWSEACEKAFHTLRQHLTSAPVLVLPDNSKPLEVLCDTSGTGLGCVLMQEGRIIAYSSRALRQKLAEGDPKYTCFQKDHKDVIWFGKRVVVPVDPEIRKKIFDEAHVSKFSIHPGSTKMYQDLKQNF
jgi:hypothetical protein